MRKYLFLYALAVTALLVAGYRRHRADTRRLRENLQTLTCDLTRYRTQLDEEIVSSRTLRLRCTEFEQLHAEDADRIRRLGIRLRRLEASARTVAATSLDARAPLRDTVVRCIRDTVVRHDTVRLFRWRDRWVALRPTRSSAASKASTRCTRSCTAFRGASSSSAGGPKPCGRRSVRPIRTRASSTRST